MKYLVIDAGGDRHTLEAGHVEIIDGENGQPDKVRFFKSAAKSEVVGQYLAPTSWGPAPADDK